MADPAARIWSCPDWAVIYRELVAAIERGEDPTAPDRRLVFTPGIPSDGSGPVRLPLPRTGHLTRRARR